MKPANAVAIIFTLDSEELGSDLFKSELSFWLLLDISELFRYLWFSIREVKKCQAMSSKPENVAQFRKLLPWGSQTQIAKKLGITKSAVNQALDKLDSAHPAVQEAVRIVQKNGAGRTQKALDNLLKEAAHEAE